MHSILIKVQKYLSDVSEGRTKPIDKQLIVDFAQANIKTLERQLSSKPEKFRLRMSNVGMPSCQLQLEAVGVQGEERPYSNIFRNCYGDVIEALVVLVLKAAGVNVVAEQVATVLEVVNERIKGTLDLIIDEGDGERVWDIKSASKWTFSHKFNSFANVVDDDPFGYAAQGFGYAKAVGRPFGGWIVVCKETGEWNVVAADDPTEEIQRTALETISRNVSIITTGQPFQKMFEDKPEMFKRKETGNRVLGITCGYCKFKSHCWPVATFRKDILSEAQNPRHKWYSYIDPKYKENKNEEETIERV